MLPNPCTVIRPNPHPGKGTVLVLGTPRGGTSVVSGICHMLGIPMGLDIDCSNMEDLEFRRRRASTAHGEMSHYFSRLREGRDIAGLKDPTIIDDLTNYWSLIPEPVLVVVSRDVYATAQREEISGIGFFDGLQEAIRRKYAVLNFVHDVDSPLIVVSYERLLQHPRAVVEGLGEFLLGEVSHDLVSLTTSLIRPHAKMPDEIDFVSARSGYAHDEHSRGEGTAA